MTFCRYLFFVLFSVWGLVLSAQNKSGISVIVTGEQEEPLAGATAELLVAKDSSLRKLQLTDDAGSTTFRNLPAGNYLVRITHLGYQTHLTQRFALIDDKYIDLPAIALQVAGDKLRSVTVLARKAFVEVKPGMTVVNMDAAISSAGTSVLEALEKLPGITIDKDGRLLLKGKSGVMVLIDGKQTYLDAAQLSNLLAGMNASQLSQVEIMDQPSAQFDAAGNAGIINLKLKKNTQKGFNGSLSAAYAQGHYPKTSNSLQLNYRTGAVNLFLNYGFNQSQSFTRLDAFRTYFKNDGSVASMLEQPGYLAGTVSSHSLRTGIDLALGRKTTVGLLLNGLSLWRRGTGNNRALWLDATGHTDSLIATHSRTHNDWKNGGVSLNFRHVFTAGSEWSADADLIGYRIGGEQFFENDGLLPWAYTEASKADMPSTIHILSAKTDYSQQQKNWILRGGAKTSQIRTDNLVAYQYFDGATWKDDLGKTNHFLYNENIQALYANAETKGKRWSWQGGLRFEATHYDARQLGNAMVKDSSFSRSYASLFPSSSASFAPDSVHTFSLSASRRIDRPPFQKLNPFLFIINKYTFQQGNPFYRPQYTWNLEFSHQYKSVLTTSLTYSVAHDYFSQVFPVNSNGIVIYTEGNLRRQQTWGASVSVKLAPAAWWSLTAQGNVLRKKLEGLIDREYSVLITQAGFNLNNQLRFNKGWAGEVSGFYTSRSQTDIQEVLDPSGQLSIGLSKAVFKNKGTFRLAARDLLYTGWMKGLTQFHLANETFKLTRDTRVLTLSFNYRFGKIFKTTKGSQGSAGEEIQRVGNG
ncbi:outer membrane beta-barrel protein [Flavisolibacter nicotianae]|uniref:outer membrane beta-barrel protein n=1 Tax=Flavisolibacter nicotianae TaxID=2364882 RepID=UPI000EB434AA|nr:outer membrane beta-barrel protein [Flavisolibacter nicotianae]